MRIPRLYSVEPIAGAGHHQLGEGPAHYLGKVLRMSAGRPLIVFDGRGGEYQATIAHIDKKSATLELGEFNPATRESPLSIELAIGISRGERFDWVLQKATELGVTQISPLFTQRVEVKLSGDRLAKKQSHWQQITRSACEQCLRTVPPQLNAPQSLSDWLGKSRAELSFVLHHRSEQSLKEITTPPKSVSILVGPEGGLSEIEIEQALTNQHKPLRLGPRVMRTETAPLAALSLLQFQWGDLG